MMKNDQDLESALRAEELALLGQIDQEPGYFSQLGTLFSGQGNWVNVVLMITQALLFIAGAFCAARFFEANDAHSAILWGIPGGVALLMALMVKLAMWPVIQANRMLRAIKRLELKLAQVRD